MKPLILFDVDGTLADTFDTSMALAKKLAPHYHIPLIPDSEIQKLRGIATRDVIRALEIPWYKLPFFVRRIRKELTQHMHKVKAFPGMLALVRKLHQDGYHLGIISSNSKKNVEIFLQTNKFPPFSATHTGIGMFAKHRILRQISKHHPTLYIGDETRDIEAAHKANIPIIAVTWGYSSKDALKKHQPTALVDTTAQLSAAIRRIALKSTKA